MHAQPAVRKTGWVRRVSPGIHRRFVADSTSSAGLTFKPLAIRASTETVGFFSPRSTPRNVGPVQVRREGKRLLRNLGLLALADAPHILGNNCDDLRITRESLAPLGPLRHAAIGPFWCWGRPHERAH